VPNRLPRLVLPSDGRALSVTKDSDVMINDAGKHEVKDGPVNCGNLRFSQ
jgi:hypothetical protein